MKITFLGTNGWYPSPTGDTPCILIDAQDRYVVLDAGSGLHKLEKYITSPKPISLFISHFHLDHTSGLHVLNKFTFSQGLDIYVGPGRQNDFTTLANPPYTVGYLPDPKNINNMKTEIRLHELKEGPNDDLPFPVEAIEQFHGYKDHGFRVKLEDKIVAYTGDCGMTDELRKLANNADVLISECANKVTPDPDLWGHLDPIKAATLAKESGVKQLLLTHFGAQIYTSLEERTWAEEKAKKIFLQTIAAKDGTEIII